MKDYVKMYVEEIELFRRQNQGKTCRLQRHHIWPASLGGENREENYVYVTDGQHKALHTIFNLALLQVGNPGAVVSLDYSQMVHFKNLDLSMFRNSRVIMSRYGVKVSVSLAKAADLLRTMNLLHSSGQPVPTNEARWRVLTAAMFGNKLCGLRMSLKLHRRRDDVAMDAFRRAVEKTEETV